MKRNSLPVNVSIELEFDPAIQLDGIRIQNNNDIICIKNGEHVQPVRAYRTVFRDRESKKRQPKIINMIPIYVDNLNLGGVRGAVTQYDRLYAIDTNTKNYKKDRLHAACYISTTFVTTKYGVVIRPDKKIRVLEFTNIYGENPECVSLEYLIKNIIVSKGEKVGVVVDSELDKVKGYNRRALPLCGSYYLPENVQIIYASADTGAEIVNKLIKIADKGSNSFFEDLVKNKFVQGVKEVHRNMPYSGFCSYVSKHTLEVGNDKVGDINIPESTEVRLFGRNFKTPITRD